MELAWNIIVVVLACVKQDCAQPPPASPLYEAILALRRPNTLTNAALDKPASMNSYREEYPPSNAVDGDTDTFIHVVQATHVTWWEVDLLNSYTIHNVTITSRDCCGTRFRNFTIDLISDHQSSGLSTSLCLYHPGYFNQFETKELTCNTPTRARRLRITMVSQDVRMLDINEVEVKALPVCGSYWFGFELTKDLKRTDPFLSESEVDTVHACISLCQDEIMCDAFHLTTSSGGVTCQLFTGRSGNSVTDTAYRHYHFSG